MVLTFFPKTVEEGYTLNFYRSTKFGENKNLITTDNGSWVLLNDEEFSLLRSFRVHEDASLFSILKEEGIVLTKDSIEKVVDDYRQRFNFLFLGPSLHIVVLTFRCNSRCVYCHSVPKLPDEKKFDLDEDTAKSIVDFILTSPSDSLIIEFQGGEPLLNFDVIKSIIEYATEQSKIKKKKVVFSLVSNLTLMDEEILKFLMRNNVIGLSTSLDGPKEVHDKNRKYINDSGTYDNVVYWIKRIKTEFKQYFSLNALTTITKYSLPYANEIPQELFDLGFSGIWLRFLNNLGFAHNIWGKIGYTSQDFLSFYKKSLEHILKLNEKRYFAEMWAVYIGKKILQKKDPMLVDFQSPCGAGIGQLVYDHKGDIFTCDEAKILGDTFKLGNVRENTLKEVINHPTVVSMMNISSKFPLICDSCVWSPYCGVCPVNFYMTQENIVPKLSGEFRCNILGEIIKTIFQKIIFSENDRKLISKWMEMPLI